MFSPTRVLSRYGGENRSNVGNVERARMIEMRSRGMSINAIAEATGRCTSAVARNSRPRPVEAEVPAPLPTPANTNVVPLHALPLGTLGNGRVVDMYNMVLQATAHLEACKAECRALGIEPDVIELLYRMRQSVA